MTCLSDVCVVGGSVVIVEGWFVSPYFFMREIHFLDILKSC